MSRSLLVKVLVTSALAIALMIPLGAIRDIVRERNARRHGVVTDIQRSAVTAQKVVGPLLVVPFRKTTIEVATDSAGKTTTFRRTEEGQVRFVPAELSVSTTVDTERRQRGIYSTLLLHSQSAITGSFAVPETFGVREPGGPTVSYAWGTAFVALGIEDTRGIKGKLVVHWDDGAGPNPREFDGGSGAPIGNGVHAPVGTLPTTARTYRFAIDLRLMGAQSLEVVPAGKETAVNIRSPWPHPSFIGQFLPETRTIGPDGFEAVWRTSRLATNIEHALDTCDTRCTQLLATTLGVSFIEPVDIYLKTERAAKYGFLYVILTFVLFGLFELLGRLAIHPVQYGLVGVALTMFFLLLIALSEHLPFAVAYVVASASCILLLGFYVSYVLRGVSRGLGFAGLLTALYGALYALLQSEDMALVLGAVLLFGIVAAVMVITRRIDWHRLTAGAAHE